MDDDFGDDFGDIVLPKNESNVEDKPSYDKPKNNYNNGEYKKFERKPAVKRNIIGDSSLNLWDDPVIDKIELDVNNFKTDKKYFSFALPSATYKISDDDRKSVIKILELLEKKNYDIRFVCTHARALYDDIKRIFGLERMMHITLWKSFCKDSSETLPLHLVSDTAIKLSAQYVRNYNNLPAGVKYIYGGVITSLFGQDGDRPSSFFITFDPFKSPKGKVDFTKSRDTSNYYMVSKTFSTEIYNLSEKAEYADIEQILL